MILFDELSQEQTQIVKQICYIQLDSLRRIYNNNHHSDKDIIDILIENEIDEASFTDKIEEKLDNFKHLNKNPKDVTDREIKAYVYNQFKKQLKEQYQLEQFRAEASAEAADNTLTETVDTNDTQA